MLCPQCLSLVHVNDSRAHEWFQGPKTQSAALCRASTEVLGLPADFLGLTQWRYYRKIIHQGFWKGSTSCSLSCAACHCYCNLLWHEIKKWALGPGFFSSITTSEWCSDLEFHQVLAASPLLLNSTLSSNASFQSFAFTHFWDSLWAGVVETRYSGISSCPISPLLPQRPPPKCSFRLIMGVLSQLKVWSTWPPLHNQTGVHLYSEEPLKFWSQIFFNLAP